MDLNATILGQMISFIFFVWFCMKYIWPKIIFVIENRKKKLEVELSILEKYKKEIESLKKKSFDILDNAQKKSKNIIQNAKNKKIILLEEAKEIIQEEKKRIISKANSEINIQKNKIKQQLMKEVNNFAITIARKILNNHFSNKSNNENIIHLFTKNL